MIAAAHEMSTPIFPREARCGLELLEPKPQTTALMISLTLNRGGFLERTVDDLVRIVNRDLDEQ